MKTREETKKEIQSLDAYTVNTDVTINAIYIKNDLGTYVLSAPPVEQLIEHGCGYMYGLSREGYMELTVMQARALMLRLAAGIKEIEDFDADVKEYFEKHNPKASK